MCVAINTVINNNDFSSCFVSVRGNNSAIGNNIFNSASCGVSGSNNEITDNIFNNSKIDIGYYGSSENNEITNNIFECSKGGRCIEICSSDTLILWTITKTAGTNIIGGRPYLGGNYWSDYKSTSKTRSYKNIGCKLELSC